MNLAQIRRGLASRNPQLRPVGGMGRAGVTLLLRYGVPAVPGAGGGSAELDSGLEILLIERATREGDPWSGHMAFPGGRAEPQDASVQQTAEREALEEVGVCLVDADYLGRLDDLGGRAAASSKLVVSAYVYYLAHPGTLEIDREEVADAFWVSLAHLVHPDHHVRYPVQYGDHEIVFPGIRVGLQKSLVVWGLTYRFLEAFFEIIGSPLCDHGIPNPETLVSLSQS